MNTEMKYYLLGGIAGTIFACIVVNILNNKWLDKQVDKVAWKIVDKFDPEITEEES